MIQTISKRSFSHPNHNEDDFCYFEYENHVVGAVMDGCSTGVDSHFASTFFKKIIYDYLQKNHFNVSVLSEDEIISEILWEVRWKMRSMKLLIRTTSLDFLSTLNIFVYNKNTKELVFKILGDGGAIVNGIKYFNDQNNVPDYLAYHVDNDLKYIDYIESAYQQKIPNVTSFSIFTDGIESFVNVKYPELSPQIAIDFLLSDKFQNMEKGLIKKYNILTNKNPEFANSEELFCWENHDDLTIIRYEDIR